MPTPVRAAAFPMILLAALTACGGGGGGGGNTIRDVPFTSFSAIGGNERVTISGNSQTAEGTNTGIIVNTFLLNPVNDSNSAMALTYDRNRNLSGISIGTPQSSVSYGGGEISCATGAACSGINATSLAVVMNPFSPSNGWDYQTFGVWLKDITATSFQAGAISAGLVTPVSGLPLGITNATFTGHAGGFYHNGTGTLFITDAEMVATTNFQTRAMTFSTHTTLLTDTSSFNTIPEPNLNLNGSWIYAAGSSQFSGTVTSASGMSGPLSGQFFGPSAQEIGGVYSLTGTGDRSMLGAFGGKRP